MKWIKSLVRLVLESAVGQIVATLLAVAAVFITGFFTDVLNIAVAFPVTFPVFSFVVFSVAVLIGCSVGWSARERIERINQEKMQYETSLRETAFNMNAACKAHIKHIYQENQLTIPISRKEYVNLLDRASGRFYIGCDKTEIEKCLSINELSANKCVVTMSALGNDLMRIAGDTILAVETSDTLFEHLNVE